MDIRMILLLAVAVFVPLSQCTSPDDFFWDETAQERDSGKVEEKLELRVFNHAINPSKERMLEILERADLESHGFTKEIIIQKTSIPSSKKTTFEKMYHYYKYVPCPDVPSVEKKMDELLEGALGLEVDAKVEEEMKARNLEQGKQCRAGLEVHVKTYDGDRRTRRSAASPWCFLLCFHVVASN